MCERARTSALGAVVTTAGAVGAVAVSRAGRVGLVALVLGAAGWMWPLVVGVGGGVLVGVAGVAYVLGASRERPLPLLMTRHRGETSERAGEARRVVELETELAQAEVITRAALRELDAARRSREDEALPLERGHVVPARVWREEG